MGRSIDSLGVATLAGREVTPFGAPQPYAAELHIENCGVDVFPLARGDAIDETSAPQLGILADGAAQQRREMGCHLALRVHTLHIGGELEIESPVPSSIETLGDELEIESPVPPHIVDETLNATKCFDDTRSA